MARVGTGRVAGRCGRLADAGGGAVQARQGIHAGHDRARDRRVGIHGSDRRAAQPARSGEGCRDVVPRTVAGRVPCCGRDVRRRRRRPPQNRARTGRQQSDAITGLTSSRGTVVGDGLTRALDEIEADWEADGVRPSAIVLLSDGADTGSVVPPDEAAARATQTGACRSSRSPSSVRGAAAPDKGSDTALLDQIATSTGGESSTASTAGELTQVYDTLGAKLSSDLAAGSSAIPLLVLTASWRSARSSCSCRVDGREAPNAADTVQPAQPSRLPPR